MGKEMITKFQGLKTKRTCGNYFSHLKLILSWQRWQLWSNMIYTPTHTQMYLKAHESMAPVSTGSENSIQVIKKDLAKSLFKKALKVKVLVAPLFMEFSRQEYWSGLPFPSPGDLPNLGIKPRSPALQADSLLSEPPGKSLNCIFPFLPKSRTVFLLWSCGSLEVYSLERVKQSLWTRWV